MTDLVQADATAHTAHNAAVRAADQAGIAVRELTSIDDQAAASRLLCEIWGRRPDNPLVPPELLRAFAKSGNYIAGAFIGGRLVGAAIAFHSEPARAVLHSHISGVDPAHAGRSIGYALKLHQRAWALRRGIDVIEWTFDPLVARNAYVNIVKLGAVPVEYLVNFYGAMTDTINSGDDTDRLLVRWSLRDPRVAAAASGHPFRVDPLATGTTAVAVPPDIEGLRQTDPGSARRWREVVRGGITDALASGGRIVGFDRRAGYVIRHKES